MYFYYISKMVEISKIEVSRTHKIIINMMDMEFCCEVTEINTETKSTSASFFKILHQRPPPLKEQTKQKRFKF